MIRITICDDDQHDIEMISDELDKYSKLNHIPINVSAFSSSKALMFELDSGNLSDIYILDVSMPDFDGFSVAEQIRSLSDKAIIMFLTSMSEKASEGYKFNALRYVLKMNINKDISEALDSAISDLSKIEEKSIMLHRYNQYWRIPYSDIICITREERKLIIDTKSHGTMTDSRGVKEFLCDLEDERFISIDRGVIINTDYITKLDGMDLYIENGKRFSISRRNIKDVKNRLFNLWKI